MRVRVSLLAGVCLAALAGSPSAQAEELQAKDHLSYYTYYRTTSTETVAEVAAKFGIAESSLIRMNPYLTQYTDGLPGGTLVCVPKDKEEPSKFLSQAKSKASSVEELEEEPKKKRRRKRRRKRRDEPSEGEWETLAELATKGAPKIARRSPSMSAPSRMISSDGSVVYIPAAKPKPAQVKASAKIARRKLSSRKGKAIHGVLTSCRSYMGTPYVWGGEQPGGFDCSGYVQYVFAKHGYKLPRTADIQYNVGKKVKRGKERPGDLVFFETYAPGASHVGVYLGRGYFIHASSSRGVTIDRLKTDFFAQRYLGAKRNI